MGWLRIPAGAGTFRGGLGARRQWRILGEESVINLRTDRFKFSSPGIFGAKPAQPSRGRTAIPARAAERPLTSKVAGLRLKKRRFAVVEFGGGGGWGDPRDARSERVRQDVERGYVSREAAREDYGVALDGRSQRRRRGDGAAARQSASRRSMKLRVGIDVGGTFTDVTAFDEDAGEIVAVRKYPSNPAQAGAPSWTQITRDLADGVRRGRGRAGPARLDRGAQHHAGRQGRQESALSPRAASATSTKSAGNGAATRCSTSSRRRPRCC